KPITLSATDVDGDSLTYKVIRWPARGTFTGTPPDLIYQPEQNYNGRDSFTFIASDGRANSNTATVKILVNDAPTGTVQINMGKSTELATRSTSVLLTLTVTDGPGPILMCISNKATCSTWMPFAGKK
ncbi:MAG: Ig-like domain-containing protein, partial [Thermoanaerobaculia bacterium]